MGAKSKPQMAQVPNHRHHFPIIVGITVLRSIRSTLFDRLIPGISNFDAFCKCHKYPSVQPKSAPKSMWDQHFPRPNLNDCAVFIALSLFALSPASDCIIILGCNNDKNAIDVHTVGQVFASCDDNR